MARFKLPPFFHRHRRLSLIALGIVTVFSLLLIPLAYSFAHFAATAPRGAFGIPILAEPESTLNPEMLSTPGGFILPEAWSGADRVTVLIMGLDYRDWSAGEGPSRTDTMILLSVDPVTKTAGVLSIPRDLWAVIPGFSPQKINAAHYFGELYKIPGGGPELAMRTVEQTIGVPIDYYVRVDFNAFIKFIDLIGGVKINVPEEIIVDPLGADTKPKRIKTGVQVLPGALALAYARERHVQGGDFSRAERQQLIILGIRDRILNLNLLPGLIANAPQIYAQLSAGITTNLSLEDAIKLAVLASEIKGDDIRRGVINEKYVIFGRSPDDLSILIPIPDKIRELRDEIFGGNTNLGPLTQGTPEERMAAEAPRLSIQNGSSDGSLGQRTGDFLANIGATIAEVRNADSALGQTVLVDHTGNPYTLAYLSQLMGVNAVRIIHDFDPNSAFDVEIRLGNDWLTTNSIP